MSTATVHFYNQINFDTANLFRNLCLSALLGSSPRSDSLTIMFSSVGGNVKAGITMYEFLRTFPIPVTICNVGCVESIACIVFLGADTRIAMPNTHFKIHGFEWNFGESIATYSDIADAYISINSDIERYAKIFEERTKGAEREVDVRAHLRGVPLVLGCDDAATVGLTTMDTREIKLGFHGNHVY